MNTCSEAKALTFFRNGMHVMPFFLRQYIPLENFSFYNKTLFTFHDTTMTFHMPMLGGRSAVDVHYDIGLTDWVHNGTLKSQIDDHWPTLLCNISIWLQYVSKYKELVD